MRYLPFEMHCHTIHSDGGMTVPELMHAAKEQSLAGIALTDHNTFAGHQEVAAALVRETLPVVYGIEWTTFFGHMLVLNPSEYVDWRFVPRDGLDSALRRLKETGAAVGLAHPNDLGSPVCTGCHWDFAVRDWNLVDYIEVWAKPYPAVKYTNGLSMRQWDGLLNSGYRIAATSGRDWHAREERPTHAACTYIGVEGEISSASVCAAICAGRTYVTAGPRIDASLEARGRESGVGGEAEPGRAALRVKVSEGERRAVWEGFHIVPNEICVVHNGNTVAWAEGTHASIPLILREGWLRIEVWGEYLKPDSRHLLGFTSPIYIAKS